MSKGARNRRKRQGTAVQDKGSASTTRAPGLGSEVLGTPIRRIIREVADDVGRLSQVKGNREERAAAKVAHFLWWTADLDSQAEVMAAMLGRFEERDIIWGCRWGPPWNASIVARSYREATLPKRSETGVGIAPFGDVLDHLYASGCTNAVELLLAALEMGIDDLAWIVDVLVSTTPLTSPQVASALHALRSPTGPILAALVSAHGLSSLDDAEIHAILRDAGMGEEDAAAATEVATTGNASVTGDHMLSPEQGVVDAWTRAFELREDGIERLQAVNDDPQTNAMLRDAYGVLRKGCDAFDSALRRTAEAGFHWRRPASWRSHDTLSTLLMFASDCNRDAGDAARRLGDLSEALMLKKESKRLAQSAGDEHGLAKSALNLAVDLIRQSRPKDLDDAAALLDTADVHYRLANVPHKRLKVEANRRFLQQARDGEDPDIPDGSRTTPWLRAHSPGEAYDSQGRRLHPRNE